jgi:acyl-CoA reductase-like NAD-dependent aldehyde dehydrogenase
METDWLPEWSTARTFAVTNPYTGEQLAELPLCGPAEVHEACSRAQAQLDRSDFSQFERARALDRAAFALEADPEPIATLITQETGKTIRESRTEVRRAVETLRFAAAEARTLSGELVPLEATFSGTGKLGMSLRVPVGVVAAISPFNFPLNTVAHKVAPAIAAGCPVVLKPAPETPLTALRFVEVLRKAGMPGAWITVVTDDEKSAGEALVHHEVPRLVTFTGSAEVGWSIAAAASRKRVALELGSNAPVIVEPDADLDRVAAKVVAAAFGTAGQSCISVQRVLVHERVHDELAARLSKSAAGLVVGDPMSESTDIGPLISKGATTRVREWIDDALAHGGTVLTGAELDGGCLRPTVLDRPGPESKIRRAEIFGPVLGLVSYSTFDEALRIAGDTPLRLQAGLFTQDLDKALAAVRRLDFGGVLINEVPTYRADHQPYGGVRDAGNTREGPAHAIREMTDLRFVSLQTGGAA